jgi:hypothetical protein
MGVYVMWELRGVEWGLEQVWGSQKVLAWRAAGTVTACRLPWVGACNSLILATAPLQVCLGLSLVEGSALESARQRRLPYGQVQRPLAVSPSRGVGCVLAGTQVWMDARVFVNVCVGVHALWLNLKEIKALCPLTEKRGPSACRGCCYLTWRRTRKRREWRVMGSSASMNGMHVQWTV